MGIREAIWTVFEPMTPELRGCIVFIGGLFVLAALVVAPLFMLLGQRRFNTIAIAFAATAAAVTALLGWWLAAAVMGIVLLGLVIVRRRLREAGLW